MHLLKSPGLQQLLDPPHLHAGQACAPAVLTSAVLHNVLAGHSRSTCSSHEPLDMSSQVDTISVGQGAPEQLAAECNMGSCHSTIECQFVHHQLRCFQRAMQYGRHLYMKDTHLHTSD